ncbi:glucose-6-phosphate dehydrogenase (NADP(+)) [bacterium]|jgi:glucose-6-phosphate 1-dehydrogenase|nr:glucose-6-phosphate dehydrogenase (NADP(+)) [bacterium]MBT3903839.1 glucose-6-phosphate dehydrogenase (NADP(+)) [bacterium]MBT4577723.1 glucose-6-phosphate dehydrogenase (NADP(+)) [bacterium]MBT5345617.1 glucose-6-phosphate dehydrogenase (NADP(+)) [bacterium]MBT6130696.1 glucose-6-phosphate dehydrogenase (NADP(+)) [bacterium]
MFNGVIVLFGVTGNLATHKLLPALYALARRAKSNFKIVGCALESIDLKELLELVKANIKDFDQESWKSFCKKIVYQQLDFTDQTGYSLLLEKVVKCEQELGGASNRLLYFSVPPQLFDLLTRSVVQISLVKSGMLGEGGQPWHRIVYEKPFGLNHAMADQINKTIEEIIDEQQIFRVDHYLLHEIVNNIVHVRFANRLFDPAWNAKNIDHVQIVMLEKSCPEGDAVTRQMGTIKDVVQSHLLQLIALVAMEQPNCLGNDSVRESKIQVMSKVEFMDGVLGIARGCKTCDDSDSPDSETFAALSFSIDTPRWQGVPFFVVTGKCLEKKETMIHIVFKPTGCSSDLTKPNILTLQIAPDEGFSVSLNVQKPGMAEGFESVTMDYCHKCIFGAMTPKAYESLFDNIIRGNRLVSVGRDEICQAWDIAEKVLERSLSMFDYQHGQNGPQEAQEFIKRSGGEWLI